MKEMSPHDVELTVKFGNGTKYTTTIYWETMQKFGMVLDTMHEITYERALDEDKKRIENNRTEQFL